MRVVFMGTPAFAVPSLLALAEAHEVVAVYTRPDKPSGRGRVPAAPPVKQQALALGIPVMQPPTLRAPGEVELLEQLRPDVVCVAAYGLLLPDDVLAVPPMGCVNVHASLLPAYRGAAPIQRAVLDGAEYTGASIMRIVTELDAGPYAAQVKIPIDEHDATELTEAVATAGAEALVAVLGEMERGSVVWVAQSDEDATYAPKITALDVALLPELDAEDGLRRVRASSASAPSRLMLGGKRVVVLKASHSHARVPEGTVEVSKDQLTIGFAAGSVRLDAIRPEGRSMMEGAAFVRGARIVTGYEWGAWV